MLDAATNLLRYQGANVERAAEGAIRAAGRERAAVQRLGVRLAEAESYVPFDCQGRQPTRTAS